MLSALRCSGNENKLVQLETLSRRLRRRSYNPIPAESQSLPHAHAQATKTYYKHQDSRINKTKDQSTTKTSATLIFKIFLRDIKSIKTKIVEGDC
ncbi:hypothetical protein Tco_1070601 [Tanacetum coccineum]|uniref:Uncharacterized protein n=1 Tax=Tanacetum coccineum TaxID=301880 RepID=A0ABQ5HM57_9ASTR